MVDDEEAITSLMATMLTFAGFEVLRAHGGTEALDVVRAQHPDLVLLDVMMPGLDGREACRRLKDDPEHCGIPVVLFSSADEIDIDWRVAGAAAFLRKPFRISSLPDFIRSVLADGG